MRGVFAGSFDPPTCGHEEIIRRAAQLFDTVIVMISVNSAKTPLFEAAQRKKWLEAICQDLPNTEVVVCEGLSVEQARRCRGDVLIRSLRNASDYPGEALNAWLNRMVEEGMETFFLMGSPEYSLLSSSAVREMLKYGQSVERMVPRVVFCSLQPELARQKGLLPA